MNMRDLAYKAEIIAIAGGAIVYYEAKELYSKSKVARAVRAVKLGLESLALRESQIKEVIEETLEERR